MPLHGFTFLTVGEGPAVAYAGGLLESLGAEVVHAGAAPPWGGLIRHHLPVADPSVLARLPVAGALDSSGVLRGAAFPVVAAPAGTDAVADWAASGAMALTGEPDGPALAPPGWGASYLAGAAAAAELLAQLVGGALAIDGPALLGERAAIVGLQRRGSISAGGASRLLACADGWVAVTLARPADFDALPAWVGASAGGLGSDPWGAVAAHVSTRTAEDAAAGAQLLGIAAAAVGAAPAECSEAASQVAGHHNVPPSKKVHYRAAPLVVDLSSLWAGPLCTSLLAAAGARVVKVESTARPDGARRGPPAFFDLLNSNKESVALDLRTPDGMDVLRHLVDHADIVVESARPRVMEQWGFDVPALVERRQRLTWVSMTGYGRTGPWSNRVGFGDDVAAGAGMVAHRAAAAASAAAASACAAAARPAAAGPGAPNFCADAFADPAGGLHAAVAALAGWLGGGGHLIDLSLHDVVQRLLMNCHSLPARSQASGVQVSPPRARVAPAAARPLGADTDRITREYRGVTRRGASSMS